MRRGLAQTLSRDVVRDVLAQAYHKASDRVWNRMWLRVYEPVNGRVQRGALGRVIFRIAERQR